MTLPPARHAVVTPVRDEEGMLRGLHATLAAQTVPPVRWVLVDTGSTDRTLELASELAETTPWLDVTRLEGRLPLARGGPIVRALTHGLDRLAPLIEEGRLDVVTKLDADIRLEPDYFERLLGQMTADARLGLASGICTELADGTWEPIYGTRDHVWGAARSYRVAALPDMLPLVERQGWDEIDALRARLVGWSTGTIVDLPFRHLRSEGQRDGERKRWLDQGETAYFMGYRPSYLLVRALFRARRDRMAVLMLPGYVRQVLRRGQRLDDPRVVRELRELQRLRHLAARAGEVRGRRASGTIGPQGGAQAP